MCFQVMAKNYRFKNSDRDKIYFAVTTVYRPTDQRIAAVIKDMLHASLKFPT